MIAVVRALSSSEGGDVQIRIPLGPHGFIPNLTKAMIGQRGHVLNHVEFATAAPYIAKHRAPIAKDAPLTSPEEYIAARPQSLPRPVQEVAAGLVIPAEQENGDIVLVSTTLRTADAAADGRKPEEGGESAPAAASSEASAESEVVSGSSESSPTV